jgi:hypothetical protein
VLCNHRNGKCEAVYAEVQGRVVEYYVSAWPEFNQTGISRSDEATNAGWAIPIRRFSLRDIHPPKNISGTSEIVFYSLQGREVVRMSGTINAGKLFVKEASFPKSYGVYRAVLSCGKWRLEGKYTRME